MSLRPLLPPACVAGAREPWDRVFASLLREASKRGRSQAQIAREYGVPRKQITRWKTPPASGSESRQVPLWALRRLAFELGYAVVLLGDSVVLVSADKLDEIV